MKKSLAETNLYLQQSSLKKEMIERFIISSSAIEGIHVTYHKKATTRKNQPSTSSKS